MKTLPVSARLYVCGVVAMGAVLLAWYLPTRSHANPSVYLALLLLSLFPSLSLALLN